MKDKIVDIWFGDSECELYFDEKYMEDFAREAKAYVKGKDKKPKTYNRKIKGATSKYNVFVNGLLYKENVSQIEIYKLRQSTEGEITWVKVQKQA